MVITLKICLPLFVDCLLVQDIFYDIEKTYTQFALEAIELFCTLCCPIHKIKAIIKLLSTQKIKGKDYLREISKLNNFKFVVLFNSLSASGKFYIFISSFRMTLTSSAFF